MKKIGAVIVAVALCIVILVLGTLVYLSNNISPISPEPKISAKITDFKITGFDNNANVGVAWDCMFTLLFLNNGTADINNITVTFNTNSTYSVDRTISGAIKSSGTFVGGGVFGMGEPFSLGSIKAGGEKQFKGEIENDLGDHKFIHGFAFIANLKSNDTVLDQATIMIP